MDSTHRLQYQAIPVAGGNVGQQNGVRRASRGLLRSSYVLSLCVLFCVIWMFVIIFVVFTYPEMPQSYAPYAMRFGWIGSVQPLVSVDGSPRVKNTVDSGSAMLLHNSIDQPGNTNERSTKSDEEPQDRLAFTTVTPTSSVVQLHGKIGRFKTNDSSFWVPTPLSETVYANLSMRSVLSSGGGFNLYLSDSLLLDRDMPDARDAECRSIPNVLEGGEKSLSVIIIFYNEPFSTLFRSVHSVLNRTPPGLLREIILVDDGSTLEWIRVAGSSALERYVELLPKTRLIRGQSRKGIVAARMLGIRNATGRLFVILDSHVEVNTGWAEPLVAQLLSQPQSVVMPLIDSINPETFEPMSGGIGCTLGFLWKLIEHGYVPDASSPKERQNKRPSETVSSPTMAGGLFAADKRFFLDQLGGYDEQFVFWGTENLELSFRVWMCGGSLLCVPCSRVYHIFRKGGVGYHSPADAVTRNKMRLLSAWMDEYGDLAWRVIGSPNVTFGSVSELQQWKKNRSCHTFSWYLHNINPEAEVQNVPADVPYLGQLENAGSHLCVAWLRTSNPKGPVAVQPCDGSSRQNWMYFRRSQHWMPVLNDESCLLAENKTIFVIDWCSPHSGRWAFDEETGLVQRQDREPKYLQNNDSECLTVQPDTGSLLLASCDKTNPHHKWHPTPYSLPQRFTAQSTESSTLPHNKL